MKANYKIIQKLKCFFVLLFLLNSCSDDIKNNDVDISSSSEDTIAIKEMGKNLTEQDKKLNLKHNINHKKTDLQHKISNLTDKPRKIVYNQNYRHNINRQTYSDFCKVLESFNVYNKKHNPYCLINVGNFELKILKCLGSNENLTYYLTEIPHTQEKFIFQVNSNKIQNDNNVRDYMKMQNVILKKVQPSRHITIKQKGFLNAKNIKDKYYMNNMVLFEKYVQGKKLKELLEEKNVEFKRLTKVLSEFIYFIIELSENGIVLDKVNLDNIFVPRAPISDSYPKLRGGEVKQFQNSKIQSLKGNIENLSFIWSWYRLHLKQKLLNIKTIIAREDLPGVLEGKTSASLIDHKAQYGKKYMPDFTMKNTIVAFHSFIITLLYIYNNPQKFINQKDIRKNIKKYYMNHLKETNPHNTIQ